MKPIIFITESSRFLLPLTQEQKKWKGRYEEILGELRLLDYGHNMRAINNVVLKQAEHMLKYKNG